MTLKAIDYITFINLPKTSCEGCGIEILIVNWLPNQCYKCRERLNPEDHIEDKLEMICDSPNTANK